MAANIEEFRVGGVRGLLDRALKTSSAGPDVERIARQILTKSCGAVQASFDNYVRQPTMEHDALLSVTFDYATAAAIVAGVLEEAHELLEANAGSVVHYYPSSVLGEERRRVFP